MEQKRDGSLVVYTVCACDQCGAGYASFWRAWAGVVMFYRIIDLDHSVAEVKPPTPMTCVACGGIGQALSSASRKTWSCSGRVAGSRKAGDSAAAINDGPSRPERAKMVCPVADAANSIRRQAAAGSGAAAVMQ